MKKLLALTLSLILLFSSCALAEETDSAVITYPATFMSNDTFEALKTLGYSSDYGAYFAAIAMMDYTTQYPDAEINYNNSIFLTDDFILFFSNSEGYVSIFYVNGGYCMISFTTFSETAVEAFLGDAAYTKISTNGLINAYTEILEVFTD